jgi:hypothetical protein
LGFVVTTLRQIVRRLDEFDDDLTIYATKPWSAESEAAVEREPEGGAFPKEAVGMDYLLEVFLAREVLQAWMSWRQGRVPTEDESCEALIYYAENDSYLPA